MDDSFDELQLSTLRHDLSDAPGVDRAGWRSARVPRVHPLTEQTQQTHHSYCHAHKRTDDAGKLPEGSNTAAECTFASN